MSPEARPAATPFEPGSGALPPALEPAITDSDSPILLLVAPDTGDAAARTAIGLADASGSAGRRTLLAEASVRDPRLHELLDVENLEGLADVFLFGASLDRVRVRPSGWPFEFIPIGAYVPEPGAVLESSRWSALARALEAEGARLFVFVPADTPGLGILSGRVGEAVLIGNEAAVERAADKLSPSCEVLAVVDPTPAPAAPAEAAAPVAAEPVEEPVGVVAGEPSMAGGGELFREPDLSEPLVLRTDRTGRRAVSPVLLVLLVLSVAAAAWYVYDVYREAPTPAPNAESAPVAAEPEAPAEPVRGEPLETPIPFSIAVEAHQDVLAARERLEALEEEAPGLAFYLVPISVDGVLYYRLLSGRVTDRDAAGRLMVRLVEEGYRTAVDAWAIRPTGLSFLLGEFETREEAEARVAELGEEGLPTYVVPIGYERGPDTYRVYGGAYASESEAAVMREMLKEAGIEARLVERTGKPVPGDS